MQRLGAIVVLLACVLPALANKPVTKVASTPGEWPQFRGPEGQGHATAQGLPTEWSETQNIAWKSPLGGTGWSSPVIQGSQVWLTVAADEGRSLRAVRVDRDSGKIVRDVEVFHQDDPGTIHKKNSHASPTPVLEDDRVYVHFGAFGTACLSTDGKILWKNNELQYNHRHGPGGSPVIYQNLLFVSCDGTDVQFVTALDKNTGSVQWKVKRPDESRMAFSTPLVVNIDGQDQLISSGGDQVIAYAPKTGQEIWRVSYDGYSLVPRPVVGHGLVFICTGYDTPSLIAVELGGQGNVTDSHVAWTMKKGAPLNPSPLLIGDELYLISDNGIASCVDARTGEKHWQQRLGGNFSASPAYADGRIYCLDEDGHAIVFAADKSEFKQLGEGRVDGRTLASMAFAGRSIFLRTDSNLYRIEEKK